ncbi:hypothetical protein [Chryseobacterium vrystaatense]|uniref:Uncharacterized protein n=1 Tax=Chryseobacterium vrystaatense TaxID=307480 RepID=A0A1M5JL84_9FLAO|nr:hypothetical protein [Chryseobacterium vrystaatense]SHG41030.1 hypothetical protein SAMN02787073_4230 [Chryseobacterium vrystaatense]
MKKILILSFLSFAIISYGQVKGDDYKRLLDSAITIKYSMHKNNIKSKKYYLINADNSKYLITHPLMDKTFETINVYDKKNKSLVKNGINVWKIIPELDKNQLVIKIIDINIYYRNRNYQFINSGGTTIVFEYSCEEKRWRLLMKENSNM